jgi:hypothetical protein
MIEIAHIPDKDNIVVDALSRYPQENGPSYEQVVDQEGIVDLDCYHLLSFQSLHTRALQVDDFTTSNSVSATEQAALVHEWATEQAATSEDVEVEQVSRVSMEDLTQARAKGMLHLCFLSQWNLKTSLKFIMTVQTSKISTNLSVPQLTSIHNMFIQNIASVKMVCYVSMME